MAAYLLNQTVDDGQINVTVNVDETTINDIAAKTGYSLEMIRSKIALYKRVLKTTLEQKLWEREQLKKTTLAGGSTVNIKMEHQYPMGERPTSGLIMQTQTPGQRPSPTSTNMELNSTSLLQMSSANGAVKQEPTDEWLPPAEFNEGEAYIPPNSMKKRSIPQGSGERQKKAKRAKTIIRKFTPHAKNILEVAWHRGIFQGKEQLQGMTSTQVLEALASFCDLTVKQVRKWASNKKQKIARMKRDGQVIDTVSQVQPDAGSGPGRFSASQRKLLETTWDLKAWQFFKNPRLLVMLTGLEEKQVRKWFQNRKDRLKREGVLIDF